MSIKVKDPITQKALGNLEIGKAPKVLRKFESIDNSIIGELKEGEYARATDGSNCFLLWVDDGKLFKTQGTEVT